MLLEAVAERISLFRRLFVHGPLSLTPSSGRPRSATHRLTAVALAPFCLR